MTRWSLLIAATLLLLTGCDDNPAPIYTKPFAQWRGTGVAALPLPTLGGPTLQVPDTGEGLCVGPNPSNSYAGCSFLLDEVSGRLATPATGYEQRLDVEMAFERDGFVELRNEARIGADQRPASDPPLGQAAVEQVLTGVSGGQRFAVGCWHRLAENAAGTGLAVDGPYACTLVIENRSLGATVVDYPAPLPPSAAAPLDRTRVDRLVVLMAAIKASFLPLGPRG